MNAKIATFVLLSAALGCDSASRSQVPGPDGGAAAESLTQRLTRAESDWGQAKPACRTYHYTRSSSSFTGSNSRTDVEITDDHPSRRRYLGHDVQDDGSVVTEQWEEDGPAIGTHDRAFAPVTVEQIFEACREATAQDPRENDVRLIIGAHGVPTACTYVPRNCADDCVMGMWVEDFACDPLPVR